jgi:hypothetical protein
MHKFNFALMLFVSFTLALLNLLHSRSVATILTNTASNCLIYWVLFNVGYALLLTKGRNAFYLGNSAVSDQDLKHKLGTNAGKIAAAAITALVLALNLVYKLLL